MRTSGEDLVTKKRPTFEERQVRKLLWYWTVHPHLRMARVSKEMELLITKYDIALREPLDHRKLSSAVRRHLRQFKKDCQRNIEDATDAFVTRFDFTRRSGHEVFTRHPLKTRMKPGSTALQELTKASPPYGGPYGDCGRCAGWNGRTEACMKQALRYWVTRRRLNCG